MNKLSKLVVETGASRPSDKMADKPIPALLSEIDDKLSGLFSLISRHELTINPILEQVPVCGEEKCCEKMQPSQLVDTLRDFSDRISVAAEYIDSLTKRSQV